VLFLLDRQPPRSVSGNFLRQQPRFDKFIELFKHGERYRDCTVNRLRWSGREDLDIPLLGSNKVESVLTARSGIASESLCARVAPKHPRWPYQRSADWRKWFSLFRSWTDMSTNRILFPMRSSWLATTAPVMSDSSPNHRVTPSLAPSGRARFVSM
jgi:hypothetical protein